MKNSVANRIISGLQEFSGALKANKPITEEFTCRKVVLDLHPTRYQPEDVKAARELLHCSQTMFGQFLGVSANAIRAWEQGVNPPPDIACRFMDEIRRDPKYWIERLKSAATVKGSVKRRKAAGGSR